MRTNRVTLVAVAATLAVAGYVGVATTTATAETSGATGSTAIEVSATSLDGLGESVVLVVGGIYDTQTQAQAAVDASNQGEFQGYYLAHTDDFDLTAVYADARPPSVGIPCEDGALTEATETLPELEQIAVRALIQECNGIKETADSYAERTGAKLDLLLDSLLIRVPVPSATTTTGLTAPAGCLPGASCLEGVTRALGTNAVMPANKWMAVSAFRTKLGAAEFLTMMRHTQETPPLATIQVKRTSGSSDLGLGQEAHPDGSGPLLDTLPNQEAYQQ